MKYLKNFFILVLLCGCAPKAPCPKTIHQPCPACPEKNETTKTGDRQNPIVSSADLSKNSQKLNYAAGFQSAHAILKEGIPYDAPAFTKGLADGMADASPLMTEAEMIEVLQRFSSLKRAAQNHERQLLGEKNKAEQEQFLKENQKRTEIHTTPSGLQYEVITSGKGKKPTATDRVTVHYQGSLLDDTIFDSSYERGEPSTFPLDRVIKGWTEVLQLMQVGAKWKVYIPSELAYAERGAGDTILPHTMLIFEIELLEIND